MLEMSYPKTNKGPSSLWTRDSASYKSNLWMNKASKGNTIRRGVILVKFKERWKCWTQKNHSNIDELNALMSGWTTLKTIRGNMDDVNKGNSFIHKAYNMFNTKWRMKMKVNIHSWNVKRVADHRPKTLELFKTNEGYCTFCTSINLDKEIVLEWILK